VLQLLRRSVLRHVWRLPCRRGCGVQRRTTLRPSATNSDPDAHEHRDTNLDRHGHRDRDGPADGYADRDSHRHRYCIADGYADPESITKHNTNRDHHSMRR
jgi:hypothetical protein